MAGTIQSSSTSLSWLDIARQLIDQQQAQGGPTVTGGGAPTKDESPVQQREIPPFVEQYLPGGAKSSVVQNAWTGGCCIGHAPVQGPPGKWTPPPAGPPAKGEPPTKGEPPIKGTAPGKGDPVQSGSGTGATYTVKRGDYLSKIAPAHGVSWQQLYWENRDQIQHPDLIYAGQVLRIPSKDLQVPDFAYSPMFTGPSVDTSPVVPDAPNKDTPPPKDTAPPKQDTPPAQVPPVDQAPPSNPSEPTAPPTSNPGDGSQTPPPPPGSSELPPTLPG